MTDVIIFGLLDNRLKIERVLSDDVNITGYSDFVALFDTDAEEEASGKRISTSFFEYKPFIEPSGLKEKKWDYIIVCNSDQKTFYSIKKRLMSYGIQEEKIIPTWCMRFGESAFQSTYREYLDSDRHFDGAVFGMSYSRRALRNDFLDHSCFKFSISGFDLRAHEIYIKNLLDNDRFKQDTKYIIIELPYYSPNWDTSCSNQMMYRMQVYEEFDEWGHYKELNGNAEKEIESWRVLKKLVSKKFETTASSVSNNFGSAKSVSSDEISQGMDKIWTKYHDETIKENTERFVNICRMLKPLGIPVIIIVFPFAPGYVEKNRVIIDKMKTVFYDMIDAGKKELEDLKVLDYFDRPDIKIVDQHFYSPSHMNEYGAVSVTRGINRYLNRYCFGEKPEDKERSRKSVSYGAYISSVGWMPWVGDNEITGTLGTYGGLKGIRVVLKDSPGVDVCYAVHAPGAGWSPLSSNGKSAIIKENSKINAVKIFTTPVADGVNGSLTLRYKVYTTEAGWSRWVGENEIAGEVDGTHQIEAIRIKAVNKER